jgi:hypothetical protein
MGVELTFMSHSSRLEHEKNRSGKMVETTHV